MERKVGVALAVMAAALTPALGSAQQTTGTVSGRIVDQSTQRPLPDVQVQVVGTQRGGVTNAQGRFAITGVPAGAQQVRARRVGYGAGTVTVTVVAGQPATADFTLAQAATQLQEVTVNAITGQQQSRLAGGTNTANVSVDSLPKGPVTQFSDVLQGRVAGVNLQNTAGQVGSSQRIRIRGANSISLSNEPLIYIDGILASNNKGGFTLGGQDYSRLNDLNFENVENVEVLKGPAATAIYGSQAANGVILITTRRGRVGKPVYRAYGEVGPVQDINKYPLNYVALTAFDKSQPIFISDSTSGNYGVLNTRNILGSSAAYNLCPNYQAAIPAGQKVGGLTTCTQDVTSSFDYFRDSRTTPFQTGTYGKYGLQVSGGSDALTYFLSGDQQNEKGVIQPNNLYRTSLQSTLGARIASNANVTISANYVRSNTNRISSDNSIFSPLINGFLGPAYYVPGMETTRFGSPGNRPGSYFGYNTADQRLNTAGQTVDRFVLGAQGRYTPLTWLAINGTIGLDQFSRLDQQTIDPSFNFPLSTQYVLGFRNASRAGSSVQSARASAVATANPLEKLTSTSTLGTDYTREYFTTVDCGGVAIPSGTRSCGAAATQFAVNEQFSDVRTISFFAQQQFSYDDRVFLTGALRGDRASPLPGTGLAYFPQVNASWVLSRERFFPQIPQVTLFRLRAATGEAGLRPGYGTSTTFFAPVAQQSAAAENSAIVLNNTGNQNLKVERTRETEGGFDLSLFRDRVTAEYTYFNKRSRDALVLRPLAPSGGLTGGVFQNLGAVTNRGQEFAVGAQLINTPKFSLATRLQGTTLKNNLAQLGNGIRPFFQGFSGTQGFVQGFPAGGFFALPYKYNDADGNGKIARNEVSIDSSRFIKIRTADGLRDTTLSLAYYGAALPTNTQGLSFDIGFLRYFRVSTLFERRAGNKQLNYTEYFRCRTNNSAPYYGVCGELGDPNASTAKQAAYVAAQFYGATPAGFIEDAKFVKWRELTLRIEAPQDIARRYLRVRNGASLSISGRNLRTWTRYSGLDPEINTSGGGALFNQSEFNTQPPVRTITFRLDVSP